jgi:glutaredoxin
MSDIDIMILTSNHCPGCVVAKRELRAAGIEFTEHNVETREGHAVAMRNNVRGGLPVFLTSCGKRFEGWHGSVEAFSKWLGK